MNCITSYYISGVNPVAINLFDLFDTDLIQVFFVEEQSTRIVVTHDQTNRIFHDFLRIFLHIGDRGPGAAHHSFMGFLVETGFFETQIQQLKHGFEILRCRATADRFRQTVDRNSAESHLPDQDFS